MDHVLWSMHAGPVQGPRTGVLAGSPLYDSVDVGQGPVSVENSQGVRPFCVRLDIVDVSMDGSHIYCLLALDVVSIII